MTNNLYQDLMRNAQGGNIISQFEQFKSAFQGDPRAEVQKLLDSGRMSQSQFKQLSQMASAFQKMMGK